MNATTKTTLDLAKIKDPNLTTAACGAVRTDTFPNVSLCTILDPIVDDLQAARAEARTFASDEGVTYGTERRGSRNWAIDPIPVLIGAAEWQALETGLRQRANLLDLVLTDVYGERNLMRRRVIPPEVILGHDGYIRQTDGIGAPGRRQMPQFNLTDEELDQLVAFLKYTSEINTANWPPNIEG